MLFTYRPGNGTQWPPWSPTPHVEKYDKEADKNVVFQSISGMPVYQRFSVEELRVEDYSLGCRARPKDTSDSRNMGTRRPAFAPTAVASSKSKESVDYICGMAAYRGWSVEELRVKDYVIAGRFVESPARAFHVAHPQTLVAAAAPSAAAAKSLSQDVTPTPTKGILVFQQIPESLRNDDPLLFDAMASLLTLNDDDESSDKDDAKSSDIHQPSIASKSVPKPETETVSSNEEEEDPVVCVQPEPMVDEPVEIDFLRITSTERNNGTGSPKHIITQVLDANKLDNYTVVSCMSAYQTWSLEELRVQDYKLGKCCSELDFSSMPLLELNGFWRRISQISQLSQSPGSEYIVPKAITWLLSYPTIIWPAFARVTESPDSLDHLITLCQSLALEVWVFPLAHVMMELGKVLRESGNKEEHDPRMDLFFTSVEQLDCSLFLFEEFSAVLAKAIKNKSKRTKKVVLSNDEYDSLKVLDIPNPGTIAAVESILPDLERKLRVLIVESAKICSIFGVRQTIDMAVAKLNAIKKEVPLKLESGIPTVEDHDPPVAPASEALHEFINPLSTPSSLTEFKTPECDEQTPSPEETKIVEIPISDDLQERKSIDEFEGALEEFETQAIPMNTHSLHSTVLGGVWEICLSDKAQAALKLLSKNEALLGTVFVKLKALAEGFWTKSICKSVPGRQGIKLSVPLFEAICFNNLVILWQVDVAYLEANQSHSQVIKIWALGTRKDVDGMLSNVEAAQKTYSIEHSRRCNLKADEIGGLVYPVVFDDDGGDSKHVTTSLLGEDGEKLDEVDSLLMHDMAVTVKFVALSKNFLHWLISKQDDAGEFPFMLSVAEDAIVRHTGSVLLCGRSGTGKTSCSVFRLLSMFYTYHSHAETPLYSQPSFKVAEHQPNTSHFHQVFLTASPDFCVRVRNYFARLLVGLTRNQTEFDANATLSSRAEAFLKTVDAHHLAGTSFLDVSTSTGSLKTALTPEAAPADTEELFEEGMETAGGMDKVPASLLDLKDHHFPLFVTYRKFASMLRRAFNLEPALAQQSDYLMSVDDLEPIEIEYPVFMLKFWKHLDVKLTHKMDPALVFNEIMGIIKGSYGAAKSEKGVLSRNEYMNLSERSFGTFKGVTARSKMYDLFLEYERVKGKELDAMDRVNQVNRAMASVLYTGPPIHEVFVDEVQDMTMAQLLPLVTICQSPGTGLMFAGDTAQTISRGSSFRFQDLSSMIYGVLEKKGGKEFASKHRPTQFQLTRNYRSHDGILRLAASVLDLITAYFPNSIDVMARDLGAVDGPLPVCFLGTDRDLFGMFGQDSDGREKAGESTGSTVLKSAVQIEFGAEQVILVRNDEDYIKLHSVLGDSALILTVQQAKGMEFEDVLIYSPFGSSPAGQGWRIFMSQIANNTEAFPEFNPEKHNLLAVELKILYTAITRARKRLWIFDSNEEARGPIFSLWKSLDLVTTITSTGDFNFTSIAQKSTPEAWRKNGKLFFERRQYEPALLCFRQEHRSKPSAQSLELCFLAEANMLRVRALRAALEGKESKSEFKQAAEVYIRCGGRERLIVAARCYERGEFYQEGGDLMVQLNLLHDAAKCFANAKKYLLAGQTLLKLCQPPNTIVSQIIQDVLDLYKLGSHHKESIDVLHQFKSYVPMNIVRRVVARASKFFDSVREKEKKLDALACLDLDESAVILTMERNFVALAELYSRHDEHLSAGEVWEYELKDLAKAELCYLDQKEEDSDVRALNCFINRLWGLLFNTKSDWFLASTVTHEEKEDILSQITKWRLKIEQFSFLSNEYSKFFSLNLIILDTAYSDEFDAAKLLLNLASLLSLGEGYQDEGSVFRLHLVCVMQTQKVLENNVKDSLLRLRLRVIQMNAASKVRLFVEQFEKGCGAYNSTIMKQLEQVMLVEEAKNVPSQRTIPEYMNPIDGEDELSIYDAHVAILTFLTHMIQHWVPSLGESVFGDFMYRVECIDEIVNGDICERGNCRELNHHFAQPSGFSFDQARITAVLQMAELAVFSRDVEKLVSTGPVSSGTESNTMTRRWMEASVVVLGSWNKSDPVDVNIRERALQHLSELIKRSLKDLVYVRWRKESSQLGSQVNIILVLRAIEVYQYLFKDPKSFFAVLSHLFSFWEVPSIVEKKLTRYLRANGIIEVMVVGLDLLRRELKHSLVYFSSWSSEIQRRSKSAILSIMESLCTYILLLEHPQVILPMSWIVQAAERFPGLDPSTLPYASTRWRRELLEAVRHLSFQSDKICQLRLGLMKTILIQHDPKVWNPSACFKEQPIRPIEQSEIPTASKVDKILSNVDEQLPGFGTEVVNIAAAVTESTCPVPTVVQPSFSVAPNSQSLKYSGLPFWTGGTKDLPPLVVALRIIEDVAHDKLVLVQGMRPELVPVNDWTDMVKKIGCTKTLDFGTVRNKGLTGSFMLMTGLNPLAEEFVPNNDMKEGIFEKSPTENQKVLDMMDLSDDSESDQVDPKDIKIDVPDSPINLKLTVSDEIFNHRKQSAVIVLQMWFRRCNFKARCQRMVRKVCAVRMLQKWIRQRQLELKSRTYDVVVLSELLVGIREWPKRLAFDASIPTHRQYRAWFLINAPEVICKLTTVLEQVVPYCKLAKHHLLNDDDAFDAQQEFISLQAKAKRMLIDIKVTSKKHTKFQIHEIKKSLHLASQLHTEIMKILFKYAPKEKKGKGSGSGGNKPKTSNTRVVTNDDEEYELKMANQDVSKKGKKFKSW